MKNPLHIVLLLVLFGPLLQSTLAQVNLDSGLVAFYPFNGNTNDVKGNNHGIGYNLIPAFDRFGFVNKAYGFNGVNSVVEVLHSPVFNFDANANSYSVVVWVNSLLPNLDTTIQARIIEKWNGGNNPYPFSWSARKTYANAVIYDSDSAEILNFGNVWNGQWHCLVQTVNATSHEMKTFVDGTLIATKTYSVIGTTANQDTIYFGNEDDGIRPYQGLMDDIRLYNRALSPEEVLALFQFGSGIDDPSIQPIKVFPNPAADVINISIDPNLKVQLVEVISMEGKVILSRSQELENPITLNLNGFAQGVYFIQTTDQYGILRQSRFVKE